MTEEFKQKAKAWIRNQTYTEEDRQKGAIEVVPTKMACFIGGYTEATKELQEENAELKKRNGELAGQKASLERWFGEAKSIIREYIRLSLQEDKDIDANVKLFQKAESFFEGVKL